ncbi:uncharacterized protein LOC126672231 [Mercurialis annua]|uniref:uncharacterized protein LOC126672231 n=1 Tax=Mercurialis annua TaxID=3986 RepID=UPI0024AD8B99|nr:uncharacterized protein LOC126672231 [Mercurialis annua]
MQELSEMISAEDITADSVSMTEDELAKYNSLKSELWPTETNNHISSLLVDGTIYSEPKDIRLHIIDFYKSLFSREGRISFDISGIAFDRTSVEQCESFIKPFEESEILIAISSCGVNKALGPDGLNFFFYRRAWPVIKDVIVDFFNRFHSFSTLPRGINSSFLVLVPKVAGSSNIKDYCPISLINGFYKMLSKALNMRLSPILAYVISDCQHGLLKGKNIMDCSMIANELIHVVI